MCFHFHFMSLKILSNSLQVLLPVILDQLPYFKVSCGEETDYLQLPSFVLFCRHDHSGSHLHINERPKFSSHSHSLFPLLFSPIYMIIYSLIYLTEMPTNIQIIMSGGTKFDIRKFLIGQSLVIALPYLHSANFFSFSLTEIQPKF